MTSVRWKLLVRMLRLAPALCGRCMSVNSREALLNKIVRVLVLAVPTNKCTPFTLFRVVDKVDFGGTLIAGGGDDDDGNGRSEGRVLSTISH